MVFKPFGRAFYIVNFWSLAEPSLTQKFALKLPFLREWEMITSHVNFNKSLILLLAITATLHWKRLWSLRNKSNTILRIRVANYTTVAKIYSNLHTMVDCHWINKIVIRNPKEAIKPNNPNDIPFPNQTLQTQLCPDHQNNCHLHLGWIHQLYGDAKKLMHKVLEPRSNLCCQKRPRGPL